MQVESVWLARGSGSSSQFSSHFLCRFGGNRSGVEGGRRRALCFYGGSAREGQRGARCQARVCSAPYSPFHVCPGERCPGPRGRQGSPQ
eukprot:9127912-Lingulodinium_polyedra.AAC.1